MQVATSVSKYQRKIPWATGNPLLSVRQAELSPCVKAMDEAESEVNHVLFNLYTHAWSNG